MTFRSVAVIAGLLSVCACTCSQNTSSDDSGYSNGSGAKISDCYAEAGQGFTQPSPERALFVIVDQSTGLDDHLRSTIVQNAKRLTQPGTTYAVYTFSAYSKGHYPTEVASGEIVAPVPKDQRPDLSVRRLRRLDRCLSKNEQATLGNLESALSEATSASSSSFANSEILASLKQVSAAINESKAPDKLVLVVSDLLEHSTTTSFYRKKTIRLIDPDVELKRAKDSGLIADFSDARVAVIGAGLLDPESDPGAVRDSKALQSLRTFWERWFEASGAKVAAYGQPDLVAPLRWDTRETKD